jgi:hypothetical protein
VDDDVHRMTVAHQAPDEIRSDEPAAACDQDATRHVHSAPRGRVR